MIALCNHLQDLVRTSDNVNSFSYVEDGLLILGYGSDDYLVDHRLVLEQLDFDVFQVVPTGDIVPFSSVLCRKEIYDVFDSISSNLVEPREENQLWKLG